MGEAGNGWRRSLAAIVTAALGALALAPPAASAKSGILDRGFGENGRVVTQTTLGGARWSDARVQVAGSPGGAIVAAVGNTVFRYLPDGSLDPGFGDSGELTIPDLGEMPFTLNDVTVDAAGRVYVLGDVRVPDVTVPVSYIGDRIHPPLAAVARYTVGGKLDAAYGESGNGYVITDLGLPSPYGSAVPYDKALTSLATGHAEPDGSLTAVGEVAALGCAHGHVPLRMQPRLIVWLTPNGGLDASYSDGTGVRTVSDLQAIGAAAIGGRDEIAVAGPAAHSCGEAVAYDVKRLGSNGRADTGFGPEGARALSSNPEAVAIDHHSRIVALFAGSWLMRLTPAGTPDRRLGRKGLAQFRLPFVVSPRSLLVDPAGGFLLAGSRLRPPRGNSRFRRAFAVARLTSHGRKDGRFAERGWATTGFGRGARSDAQEAFVDSRGRLVVAGPIARPDLAPTGGIALARYRLGR